MKPAAVPPHIARLMAPADRRALGVLTPDERHAQAEARREADLQRLCELELSRRGIIFLHLSPRARERAGWPDLVFALHGRPFAVELKTLAGRLSLDQADVLSRLARNGWNTHVIRSFEDFTALLEPPHA